MTENENNKGGKVELVGLEKEMVAATIEPLKKNKGKISKDHRKKKIKPIMSEGVADKISEGSVGREEVVSEGILSPRDIEKITREGIFYKKYSNKNKEN